MESSRKNLFINREGIREKDLFAGDRPAFIFDLDDTLYDRCVPFRSAWEKTLGTRNMSGESWHSLFMRFRFHGYECFEDSMNGIISMEEMYIYRIRATARDIGLIISDPQASAFQESYAWHQYHLILGDAERMLLDFLQKQNVFLGMITNGKREHQKEKFDAMGLEHWFPGNRLIISEDVGSSKPDPRIFRHAQELWNLDLSRTWYIGDSPAHDIDGAAESGWRTIWLSRDNSDERPRHTPDAEARNIPELLNAVKKICQF